jgi:uncharacterized repeat protein (TIGR01451 family)
MLRIAIAFLISAGLYLANSSATLAADTTRPTAPTGLAATVISNSQINLTWVASTDNVGVMGYQVLRCQGSTCTNFAQVGTSAITSFTNTGLTAATTYRFRALAFDAAGNVSTNSNTVSATTQSAPDLTLTKTHTGNYFQGQTGATYALTVTNGGIGSSSGMVTVTDTLPAGLTATAIAGTGWSCTLATLTCTRSTALAAGASYPPITLTVNVAASAAASVTNTATVSGGGDVNTANNTTSDVTTIDAPVAAGGLVAAYSFSESAAGTTTADASGNNNTGTISGATWTAAGKYGNALVFNGTNALVTIPNAASLQLTTGMTLEAWVNPSVVTAAWRDVIYKGSNGADNYYLEATTPTGAPGAGGAFGEIYGTAALPVNTWTHLAVTYDRVTLRLYVNGVQVSSVAATGAISTSTNPLQIGGDSNYGQFFQGMIDEVRIYNRALTPTEIQADMTGQISPQPDLTLTKTHVGNFTQGQTGATYTITATNSGTGPSSGTVTVTDTLPAGLTATGIAGTGWSCTQPAGPCTRSDVLAAGASYPALTLTVNVAANAPASVTNAAAVSGGGEINTSNDTASDVTLIVQPQLPDLTLTKTHVGNFTQGQTGATYTITATNSGTGPSSGTVTVTDTLPAGLTATGIAGTGWSCTQPAGPCTRSDVLAGGAYPAITLTVNVAANAPASVTNTAAVSGGGEVNTNNNTASDVTTIGPPQQPDLTLTKTHTGNFTQGQTGATYTITASNSGTGPSTGTVTVTDTLPAGLTATGIAGTGWSCTLATLTCTRSDALAAGASYPALTLTVSVAANAAASVTNTAAVSGGGEVNINNNTASDVTLIVLPQQPDLTLTKTHTGNFTQGQTGATYTIAVTNSGTGPSSGTVTVTDTLPAGLTATAIAGTGWTCTQPAGPCTRSDVLAAGASYPALTLTVDVAVNAPTSLTNIATVSGGGDVNSANNSASDVTLVAHVTDMIVSKTHVGNFTQGQIGATYTITVTNSGGGGASSGTVTVSDTLPAGLTATAIAGTGWSCTLATLTCTRSDALGAGGSYPAITVTVNVAANAAASVTNIATVSGGGEVNTANNTASDVTTISAQAAPAGLVAAYTFNEGVGTTVADSSGNNNTGTISAATWTATGKYGNALVFNGTGALVTVPNAASLQLTTGVTLEAWVNPSVVTAAWRDVIYKGSNGADNYYLEATTPIGGGAPGAGGTFGEIYGTAALPVNTWTHLAVTYDRVVQRLYVNGVQVSSVAATGAISTSTNPLQIGGDSIYGQFFQGMIDEVRIYNRALSPSEIAADMATPIGTVGSLPQVTLSTASINFPSQTTGTTSSAQTVTVTNTGTAPLLISSITLAGPQSFDYGQTNNCGASLAPSASCAINVVFSPTATGTRSASVVISDNAPGGTQTIALSGTGIAFTGLTVSPKVATLMLTRTQQFTANSGGVTWLVDSIAGGSGTVGTISPSGLYTPPNTAGVHTVTASAAGQTANATVYVTNNPGVFTHHNDNARTGQNLNETVLTPANVNAASFGKLFSYTLDGIAYASPLYVANVNISGVGLRNVVYVATEHNTVYAFDADGLSSTPLWQVSFNNPAAGVTPVPSLDADPDADIGPETGNTGTPVIDPATGTLYLVARTKEVTGTTTNYVQKLHALDIATGAEKFGGPVALQASVPGTGAGSQGGQLPFNTLHQNQRAALLLSNGVVYIGFGSHSDVSPYHGWVLGYNATTLQQTMVFNASPNGEGGGIWQSGGGLATDAAGNIYFATGNGSFSANTGGKDYSMSFVKLCPVGSVVCTAGSVLGYFTPYNQAASSSNNLDLGAGGVLLLPDQAGVHPHLLIFGGKDATIYLVDRDNPGGFNPNNNSQAVQTLPNIFPVSTSNVPGNYSTPVYFNGSVYFGPVIDTLQAFALNNGVLSTAPTSRSAVTYGYPGGTLAVSANGTTNGILWAIQRNGLLEGGQNTAPAVLRAYDPANLATELYNSNQAGSRDTMDFATKFSVPLVVNGKVFVGSEGKLTVYGLLP